PEASITIDTVAGDDRVNIAESNQAINVTGKVGNNVQAGDAVTVTVGNETYQTTVNADGVSWSVSVPGSVLTANTNVTASVTTTDAAGNTTTAEANRPYTVDTVAPEASITIDTIAGDDVVNIAESSQAINVTGKVGNNVQADDAVTVTVGNETYQTTVNADGTSWSVNVPGSVLAGNTEINASVTTADSAGNTTTISADRSYTVDTLSPEASITIDTIAGDDMVNIAESGQTINVTGRVGNNVQAGDVVTVTVGSETYQTTVNADGISWSVNIPGSVLAANTNVTASVTTADAAGNTTTAEASRPYAVDTVAPDASITIDTIAGDDRVNIAESSQSVNISGKVSNNVQAGDAVTVTVGAETYQTTVNADGISWSVSVPGSVLAANTEINASVTTADAAGNTTTAEASRPYAVDTVAPDASITIDTVAGDDVVNIAESNQTINVAGRVGNNVQAGDAVTVTVGAETYQTTVNADGVSWSVDVPGSVLAGNTEINASVTTADAAGNSTTVSADRSYTVDTIAPDASITIDTIAGDDRVNIAESSQSVNISGQVGNNVQAGDTVTVTVGSETYQTTVNADDISWSVSVPGNVLAGNTEINASVTTADAAGNTTTASANRSYTVDTVAPDASITIDTVAGDDVVNIAESSQAINVTGKVGNNVQAGDAVTVTVGAETYQTTVNADGVSWSIDIPGSVLASNLAVSASVTTADAAGNTTTAEANRPYTVDTIAPEASITIDTIAGDDMVNIAESGQTVNVTGSVGNNVQAGDTVTVTVGNETYQTTVNADGTSWSVNVPGSVLAGNTEINASVTTADAAGNTTTAEASRPYAVDTVAPDASITIDTVAGDDMVNIDESNQTINVTGKVGNNVQAGDAVTVTVGSETYQTTVNADGISWSVSVPGNVLAGNTEINASVTTADAAGNTTTAEANRPYAVDTIAPDASITIDTVAGDDVVNIAESGQTINVTGRVGNNVQAGDAVTVTVGAETFQTTVNADGVSWSVSVPGNVLAGNTEINASVTTADAAGNTTTAEASRPYAVDTVAPDASITIDTVAGDDVVNIAESSQAINVTGKVGNNVQAGDAVTVTVGSETYQTTVNADGISWSIDIPGSVLASNLAVSASVTTADAAGNTTTAEASRPYTVDTIAPEASITIDTIAGDDVVNIAESNQAINVTGKVGNNVQAGDTVTVTVGSETYQTTVNADGITWSVIVLGSILASNTQVNASIAITDTAGNTNVAEAIRPYTIDTVAPEIDITHFAGNDGYISQYELINTPISGTSSEKTVDLVFTDVNGKSVTLSNVPVVDGRWQTQTDLSSLAEGKITVDATATDQAGNQSVDSSNAVMDATPPIAHNNSVTGSEDSPLHIGWSDLGVSADTASIVISALPTANVGILYFNDGGDWKAVTIGQEFTAQNLDLRFEPVENAAGLPFSEFLYQPVDAVGNIGSNASVSIDITPVADAPIVTLNITSGETTPAASEIIAVNGGSENGGFDIQDGQIIAIGDGVRVWLTEGDPLPTVVGSGTVAYYSQGNTSGDGNYADIFVVHSGSGYFYRQSDWSEDQKQLKLLDSFNGNRTSNGSGAHQDYVFVMKEDGYTYSASNSTNNNQDSSVNTLDGLKVNYTDSEGNSGSFTTQVSNNIEGVIYSDGTTYTPGSNSATIEKVSGQAGTQEHTIEVSASLVDLDGSETLSGITLTGIPEGTILNDHINNVTYTVGSDGSYLIPNTQGASTLAGTITISVPVDVGEFSVVAQATSTESANYDSATGSSMEGVEQYGLSIGSTGNDDMPGTNSHDLMVADVSGLQLVEGQNYNIAFMVDSSGSMSSSDIAKTQASLTDVFNSLVKSASGTNAGTVNVFLADFDTQVGKTVSVNLSDPNALQSLTDVLNSMVGGSASGGGTNYEDVFKTTANWFQSDTVTSNVGNNLTYFITDGEPTFYQIIESNEVRVSDRWQSLNIDNITYTPGQSYYMDVRGAMREVIDAQGNVYQYHGGLWNSVTKTVIGQVHAQGDGTYEISSLGGAGNNNSYWNGWRWVDNSGNLDTSNTHAAEAFSQLKALSNVEAIGIGNDLNASSLQHYDTDGYVQDHIDPSQLNEAILGSNEPMKAGDDYLDGGLGNDILFGDVVAFDNIEGNGLSALQSYIAEKMGVQDGTSVTAKDMHGYITSHSSEFDLPSANDGNDILNGGAGNDILFGQGGRDILNGGSGNDLLYGGSGDDLLIGGAGNDVLIGGAGADTFTWQAGEVGHDIIKDFNANEGDRIDLSDLIGELEEGTDISRYLRITENQGSPVIEVSTEGNFTGDKGGTVAVSITLEHYSGDLPSLESLISKPDQVIN
ncbi:beta strand repeat-containing protein, partial [Brenneria alni]|uniref:beta strand repeat-containing protein n=1 Tax=Brenneria alni TaxID=71656 RepID=UPI000EF290F7